MTLREKNFLLFLATFFLIRVVTLFWHHECVVAGTSARQNRGHKTQMGIPGGVVIASSCLVKKSNSLAVHQGVPGACECPREQKAAGLIKAVLKTVKQNSRNCNVSRIEVDSGKKKTFESKEVVKLLPA